LSFLPPHFLLTMPFPRSLGTSLLPCVILEFEYYQFSSCVPFGVCLLCSPSVVQIMDPVNRCALFFFHFFFFLSPPPPFFFDRPFGQQTSVFPIALSLALCCHFPPEVFPTVTLSPLSSCNFWFFRSVLEMQFSLPPSCPNFLIFSPPLFSVSVGWRHFY